MSVNSPPLPPPIAAYPAPPPGPNDRPPSYGSPPPTSKADLAFTLGIVSIFFNFFYIPGILAIVWGGRERRTNGKARKGFVCGIVGTAISALLTVIIIGVAAGSGNAAKTAANTAATAPTRAVASNSTHPTPAASLPAVVATHPAPATSVPAAVTTRPNPSVAAAAKAITLLDQSGSGSASTQSFSVGSEWSLTWSYDCAAFGSQGNFQVYIQALGGGLTDLAGVNQLGQNGSSTESYHEAGTFYLQMNSECSWHVTATGVGKSAPAAAPKAAGNTVLDRTGSGSASTQSFTVGSEWSLTWSYNCAAFGSQGNFQVYIQAAGGGLTDLAGVNQLGQNGSSTESYHEAGTFYLQMNSECSWHVTATG